jgi:hypothetical protein
LLFSLLQPWFALAIANSTFTVSCGNPAFEVNMPNWFDIWMNVWPPSSPQTQRQENPS